MRAGCFYDDQSIKGGKLHKVDTALLPRCSAVQPTKLFVINVTGRSTVRERCHSVIWPCIVGQVMSRFRVDSHYTARQDNDTTRQIQRAFTFTVS
jgi:hypothetical protein